MDYDLNLISPLLQEPMELARWMADERFLEVDDVSCPNCDAILQLQSVCRYQDGVCLRCPHSWCRSFFSVRLHSYFQGSKLSLSKQLQLTVLFVSDSTVASAARLVSVDKKSVVNFFDNCRGRWIDDINLNPIRFQDNGEYEVDECIIKNVYDPTHHIVTDIWVQGMYERATGKLMLYRIQDRTFPSMCGPVWQHIPIGSFVYTDEHASYQRLHGDNSHYMHFTVNHSRNEYARMETLSDGTQINVHINTMEGIFCSLRHRLSYKSRRTLDRVDLILSEYVYRRSGRNLFEPFRM